METPKMSADRQGLAWVEHWQLVAVSLIEHWQLVALADLTMTVLKRLVAVLLPLELRLMA
jgi:hypothetical protein